MTRQRQSQTQIWPVKTFPLLNNYLSTKFTELCIDSLLKIRLFLIAFYDNCTSIS